MTTQHTPGPWTLDPTVQDLDPDGHVDGGFYARSVSPGIAEVYWHGKETDAQTLANGRLIAAAPDLADLARHPQWEVIMGALSKWTDKGGSDLVALGIIGSGLLAIDDVRRAAITKAEAT